MSTKHLADASREAMPKLLRFADLREARIVTSWPVLKQRILHDGFPPGRLLSPSVRVWTEREIIEWLNSRPTGRVLPIPVGRPRRKKADGAADPNT